MLSKLYFLVFFSAFHTVNFNTCCNNTNEPKITVTGTAISMKHVAAVLTENNDRYYLEGVEEWGENYLGKRVRVSGRLLVTEYKEQKNKNPTITDLRQQRLGTWKIIKKPRWSLAE